MYWEDSEEEEEQETPAQLRAAQGQKRRWQDEEEEEGESEGEWSVPRKRPALRKPAGQAAEEEEEDTFSERESTEEEEGVEVSLPPRRASKPAPFVPAPPAEPRSCSDMLSLLFACPATIDALLAPDGLRSITLVRDAAQLAIALCAHSSDMAALWQQLARRCDPRLAGGATDAQALAMVQRAVRADPVSSECICTATAQRQYWLTLEELQGLSYDFRCSLSHWGREKTFCKLDVLAIAHRKWGHLAVLEEQRAAVRERNARAKEALQGKADRRERVMARALARAGLEGPRSRHHSHSARQEIKAYIQRSKGTIADIVEFIVWENKEAEDRQRRREERERRSAALLLREGLEDEISGDIAAAFVDGSVANQTPAQAVAAIKHAKAEAEALPARRSRIVQLLTAEGLLDYLPLSYGTGSGGFGYYHSPVPGLNDYVDYGEGSERAGKVLAAARAFHEQVQAKEQRSAVVLAALEAEGLQDYNNPSALPGLTKFVERGEGRLQQLVAAARRLRRQDDKLNARRARLEELLAAQGLQQYASTRAANTFLRGRGSEAEVLEAAHAEAHQAAARQQREHALKAALHAEGIDFDKASTGTPGRLQLPVVTKFIDEGRIRQENALAAVRAAHQAMQAREQRRAQLAALLQAEGLPLHDYQYSIAGMDTFIETGTGSPQRLVARAVAASQAANPPPGLQAYTV
ncbi:hypothetical protein ABPG77_006978 [Micractinium sp. CCAP 211/92]